MSLENFKQVTENPNPHGVCCCQPRGANVPTEGPYTIFLEAELDSPTDPFPVVCAGCIRAANTRLGGAAVNNESFIKAAADPEPTTKFADLPAPTQQNILGSFEPGALVGLGEGEYVVVPGDAPEVDGEVDPLAALADEAPDTQYEPGAREGELVPVEGD